HRDTLTCDDLLAQLRSLVTALEAWRLVLACIGAQSMNTCAGSGFCQCGSKDPILCGRSADVEMKLSKSRKEGRYGRRKNDPSATGRQYVSHLDMCSGL
ncbi:hypothetical protein CCMA1212_001200, partial [Trichoderma ghanense]